MDREKHIANLPKIHIPDAAKKANFTAGKTFKERIQWIGENVHLSPGQMHARMQFGEQVSLNVADMVVYQLVYRAAILGELPAMQMFVKYFDNEVEKENQNLSVVQNNLNLQLDRGAKNLLDYMGVTIDNEPPQSTKKPIEAEKDWSFLD